MKQQKGAFVISLITILILRCSKMEKFSRKIKFDTIKALIARTGNQCAFPNCEHPIFDDNNLFVAQLCHIEAVSPDGPRYNRNNSIETVNAYHNLIFLCYRHHKVTDDTVIYTTEVLRKIKENHEIRFRELTFKIEDSLVNQVLQEIDGFWVEIDTIAKSDEMFSGKMDIDASASDEKLLRDIRQLFKGLVWIEDTLRKELKTTHFEIVCLALPNSISRLVVLIEQLEIKLYELKLLNKPSDELLRKKLASLMEKFKETAKYAGLAD